MLKPNPRGGTYLKKCLDIFIVLCILAGTGCSLPFTKIGGKETAAPVVVSQPATSQTAPVVTPTVTREPLPPAIVETDPAQGSELPLKSDITFYFNQPMERPSLESAVTFKPGVSGKFTWLDGQTAKFSPAEPFAATSELTVSIANTAKALNGIKLQEAVVLQFRTAQYLRISEHLPRPGTADVDPSGAVLVTFNQPVTPLSPEGVDTPPAFSLNPPASGRGEWLNTATYAFYPEPALAGGKTYTVSLNRQTVSSSGAGFAADDPGAENWSFSTSVPAVLSLMPDPANLLGLDTEIKLVFNQPMDRASVEENFSLQDGVGNKYPGKITWSDDGTNMTFIPGTLLPRATSLNLTISANARGLGGTTLGSDLLRQYWTVPAMDILDTTPAADSLLDASNGYSSMTVRFTAPLGKQNLDGLVTLEPPVDEFQINYKGGWNSLTLSGVFRMSAEYTLRVSASIEDQWGQPMKRPFIFKFRTADGQPKLVIPMLLAGSSDMLFFPPGETSLPAQATNLKNVQMSMASLSVEQFNMLAGNFDQRKNFESDQQRSWQVGINIPQNSTSQVKLALTPDKSPLETGLYLYQARNPVLEGERKYPPSPFLVVVSRIHLALKRSSDRLFIWAVNLDDNLPASDLLLNIMNMKDNSVAGSCATDSSGICEVKLPEKSDSGTYYVVTGVPGEANFSLASEDWTSGVSGWSFGLLNKLSPVEPFVYLYSDRPIYRPGQVVNFRAIVRQADNGRYSISSQKQINVVTSGDLSAPGTEGGKITTAVPLDAYGTGWGSITLPEDAQPGYYQITVEGNNAAYLDFQVANYRKPQIDLSVKPGKIDLLRGESLKAAVQANYFYGAPAASKDINWTLYASRTSFEMGGGFQTGKEFDYFESYFGFPGLGTYVSYGNGTLDSNGHLELDIPLSDAEMVDFESMQRLTLEVTIADESNMTVSAQAVAILHPAEFYIGAQPENQGGSAGKEIGIDVQTTDWQGAASAGHTLKASFQKILWKQQSFGDWNMSTSPDKPIYEEVSSADFRTDEKGQARLAFTPLAPGSYRLEISGQGAVTQTNLWVGGEGSASWPVLPNQHITLESDAKQYKPGQIAKLFIPNPLETRVLALVTVERARVMRSQVIEIGGQNGELQLPLGEEDAPNVYVSVLMLGKKADGSPDFRMGYLNLDVDPAALTLNVKMTPTAERYLPATQARFEILVKDQKGKPAQGEFSLALVDKAVFALADPNALKVDKAFYGKQYLGVISAMSMAVYGGRIPYSPLGKGGGGGGNGEPVLRQNFKDTAYWNTTIVTDADGKAIVDIKLPDNLTTWVATLRGITSDGLVGEAEVNLVVTKDLLVTPVTPRFMVVGDHVQLAAVVHNNTNRDLSTEVLLEAKGVTLDDPKQAQQQVELSAGGQKRVEWWVKTQDVEKVDLVFGVKSGDLNDLSTPEQGSLPVLKYSSPEVFSTSGVLTEGGQRLELVSLPRSFQPTGGKLDVEMAPSLAATVLSGLKALENFPYDSTEGLLSRLIPNVETYKALQSLNLENPGLKQQLDKSIKDNLRKLLKQQNDDGGWGWVKGAPSGDLISAYALLGLSRAGASGFFLDRVVIQKAQGYLAGTLITPDMAKQNVEIERAVFSHYALQESGAGDPGIGMFYDYRLRLNPWAQALLMLTLEGQDSGSAEAQTLLSELEAGASRMASGAYWKESFPGGWNLSTPNFNTAVVVYALAKVDPISTLAGDAIRYLAAHRGACTCWGSSYESAWVLTAMVENLVATGDLRASFDFSADINGSRMAAGKAGTDSIGSVVNGSVPLSSLDSGQPNALKIIRGAGDGRLYYRASLEVHRPVENAPAVQRGLTLTRRYQKAGQTCKGASCPTINSISAGAGGGMVRVRLSLVVPEEMYYVNVEDTIPAGMEILDRQLKSSQQSGNPADLGDYNPRDPLAEGWGWWYFSQPHIYDDHIRWTTEFLAPGPYELTYLLIPLQPGEYRTIPARAYPTYFPEILGSSGGGVFNILP